MSNETKLISLGEHPRVREAELGLVRLDDGGTAPNGEPFDEMFVFSTERLASDGGIIYADAWELARYRQNPLFLANHDTGGWKALSLVRQVAGRTVDVAVRTDLPSELTDNGRGLVGWVRFMPTSFGQDVRLLYKEGGLRAVSVHWDWQSEEARSPFEEEVRKHGDGLYWVVTRAELLETSSVTLGADPGALAIRGRDDAGVPLFETPERVILRPDMLEAMTRCRARGHRMEALGRLVKQVEDRMPTEIIIDTESDAEEPEAASERSDVDGMALSDALEGFDRALDMFDQIVGAMPTVRDALVNSRSEIEALTAGSDTLDLDLGGDDDEEDRARDADKTLIDQIRQSATEVQEAGREVLAALVATETVREDADADADAGDPSASGTDAGVKPEGAGAAAEGTGEGEVDGEADEPGPESKELVDGEVAAETDEQPTDEVTEPESGGDGSEEFDDGFVDLDAALADQTA